MSSDSRHLWVLRHAKAEAALPGESDHPRKLTDRGKRQARKVRSEGVGLATAAGAPLPGIVLTSSAARARETAELVLPALGGAELEEEPSLYGADPDDVIELVRNRDDDSDSVMVVGHNPTLEDLVFMLVGGMRDESDSAGARPFEGLRTGDLAVVLVDIASWSRLHIGTDAHIECAYSPHGHPK
ncbi:MAG TPA: histidine phosphatase family protein [Acidimicrobiales bacterium]|nr:histidine phosphatase family protein [Acidimicrobiales bacterium]